MSQLLRGVLSDAAVCGMLRNSNRGPRFEPSSSHQDLTIGAWLMRCSFLSAGSLRDQERASRGIAAECGAPRAHSILCAFAVLLTKLKSGLVLSPGDRFRRGFLHASSLFSYEAVQNREKNPRTRQKVLMHNMMGPCTPLHGCGGVLWPLPAGPLPWGVVL